MTCNDCGNSNLLKTTNPYNLQRDLKVGFICKYCYKEFTPNDCVYHCKCYYINEKVQP